MAGRPNDKNNGSGFMTMAVFILLIAAMLLIPATSMDAAYRGEQQQMTAWAGEATNNWIMRQATEALTGLAKETTKAAGEMGSSEIALWATERMYVVLLWACLLVYRAYTLLMWGLLGIPFLLAASADGFYMREIRKTSFVSQSPIRHKIGVHFFRLVSLVVVIWLFAPMPMPFVAAPGVICFLAMSIWMWVGHLQKRL